MSDAAEAGTAVDTAADMVEVDREQVITGLMRAYGLSRTQAEQAINDVVNVFGCGRCVE